MAVYFYLVCKPPLNTKENKNLHTMPNIIDILRGKIVKNNAHTFSAMADETDVCFVHMDISEKADW